MRQLVLTFKSLKLSVLVKAKYVNFIYLPSFSSPLQSHLLHFTSRSANFTPFLFIPGVSYRPSPSSLLTLSLLLSLDHYTLSVSQVAVADVVDVVVLLMNPGGGDELQGIKKGSYFLHTPSIALRSNTCRYFPSSSFVTFSISLTLSCPPPSHF